MDEADFIQQQDQQRTARAFIGFLSAAFGVDQAAAGADNGAYNSPYRYQVIGPTGVGVEGAPRSTAQPAAAAAVSLPLVLLIAAGVWLLAKG